MEKRAIALKLRAGGSTYREIAAEMDISLTYAFLLVRDGMAELRDTATESADEARALEGVLDPAMTTHTLQFRQTCLSCGHSAAEFRRVRE